MSADADGGGERVLILSAGVGSGHNSAAEALKEACEARPDVAVVEVLDVLEVSTALYRDLLGKGYFVLVDGAPWLVSWGYDISDQPFKRRGPVDPWTRLNALPALRELRRFRPTVVICTHFLPAELVSSLVLRGSLEARMAIVTTDYDFQGLWLTSAFHRMYLARDEARVQLAELGVPADRLSATGIPVRPQPAGAPGPDPDLPPMLLVSAGAAGGSYATAVVRQARRLRSPFRATVVCGRSVALKAEVEALVEGDDRFTVLGFTDRMPELLRAASLFVGKPGGLSASECMAAGLPMVLVNPIPGQEVRNGDYLIEQGAAVRCNTATTIGWKIDGILSDPGRLQRMRERAAALGRPDAAQRIVAELIEGPAAPLVITRSAQKAMLEASEKHLSAVDLEGPSALEVLADAQTDDSLVVLRAEDLERLRGWLGEDDGALVLDRAGVGHLGQHWGARRLAERVLDGAESRALTVR